MKHPSLKYYKVEHFKLIEQAETFEELSKIAIDILKCMPKSIAMACGPISSGGTGNLDTNLEIYTKTVNKLWDKKINVFTWEPFQNRLGVLKAKSGNTFKERNLTLLEGFYGPLYRSKLITKMYFIHGWESSHGSNWEINIAREVGIEIEDLPKDFLEK
jgi:hypothetical protein